MIITAIVIQIDGKFGYLKGDPIIWNDDPITTDITKANNYENDKKLLDDVNTLVLPTDEMYAKSGLRVDLIRVDKVTVKVVESLSMPARLPHTSNREKKDTYF